MVLNSALLYAILQYSTLLYSVLLYLSLLYSFIHQEETEELKKRLVVLENQLRKSEATKKGFEISTAKLLSFVEVKLSQTLF